MRIKGTLVKWNDERGFGFISPALGGPEVFVHISSFPKDDRRPTIGERLTFEIEIDSTGRKSAKHLHCYTRPTRQAANRRPGKKPRLPERIIMVVIVVALVFFGYSKYTHVIKPQPADTPHSAITPPLSVGVSSGNTVASPAFHCDDRTHCSQMTSCAEATYFLGNCPDVQMDGDEDGIPCERQWCRN